MRAPQTSLPAPSPPGLGLSAASELVPRHAVQLLTQAQAGLVLLDGGNVRLANPAAAQMFGCEPQRLIGQPWLRFIAKADHLQVLAQRQRRLEGEPGKAYDVRCVRPDGSEFDGRVCGQLVDIDGRPANLLTLFDVSEQKAALRRAEWHAEMLARSEALCRSGSFELAWPSGQVISSSGLRMLVGEATPAAGPELIDALPWVPADERSLVATIWRHAVLDEPFEFQHRVLCADGQLLTVLHRGVLHRAKDGHVGQRGIAILQDITQQRQAEHRIHELANFDEVTGLPNRTNFLGQIDAHAQAALREECGLTLHVIEVPRIVELKASMGFGAGDTLAMAIAARLRQFSDEREAVAHLGDSEFALLQRHEGPHEVEAARARAQALQTCLQQPVLLGATDVFPLCLIGIAAFPADGASAEELLEAAQTARLGAAATGGVAFFRPESNAQAVRELQLAAALRHAIERNELTVLYQPQVSLASGQIIGAEALLRWHSPDWGQVPPTEFIPVAERAGLIGAIDDWVLRQACAQSLAWQRQGLPLVRIGVNFSPLQFQQGDVAQQVQKALLDTGADPACLGVELTESTLMDDPVRAAAMLCELKSIGIEISLDDFGTGYSSLSCLRSLPIDVVKVDRSFVNDVTAGPESASVTRSIITMAHGLQMRVIAEGVETEAQLSLLLAKGCDQIQGYWFSPPVPADEVARMLAEHRCLPEHLTTRRSRPRTLLLVDDEENIVSALKRLFRRDGYRVITACSAAEGLQRLAETEVDVIISDQRMPGMTGVEFLRQAKALYPDTVRMTLSGFTDLQSIIDAVNEGAVYKFLTKPWDDERLRAHVVEAFRRKELADENRRLDLEVTGANREMAELNARLERLLGQQREQAALLQTSAGGAHELLDSLPQAVLGLDPDGLLAYVNETARQWLPAEQLPLGMAPGPLLAPALALPPGGTGTLLVHGQRCRAWKRSVYTPDGRPRGEMLVLMCPPMPAPFTAEPLLQATVSETAR